MSSESAKFTANNFSKWQVKCQFMGKMPRAALGVASFENKLDLVVYKRWFN